MQVFVSSRYRMAEEVSIEGWGKGNRSLFRTLKDRIVDANVVEETRRPSCSFDRFEDDCFPFAPD